MKRFFIKKIKTSANPNQARYQVDYLPATEYSEEHGKIACRAAIFRGFRG
jgi:hypothetical protein